MCFFGCQVFIKYKFHEITFTCYLVMAEARMNDGWMDNVKPICLCLHQNTVLLVTLGYDLNTVLLVRIKTLYSWLGSIHCTLGQNKKLYS